MMTPLLEHLPQVRWYWFWAVAFVLGILFGPKDPPSAEPQLSFSFMERAQAKNFPHRYPYATLGGPL